MLIIFCIVYFVFLFFLLLLNRLLGKVKKVAPIQYIIFQNPDSISVGIYSQHDLHKCTV
mgnify:CR=1 FL=1